jgi:hypothetical protein
MTLKLEEGIEQYTVAFDVPNATGSWNLQLESQYSHTDLFNGAVGIDTTNARYTEFIIDFNSDVYDQHINGIYNYKITNNEVEYIGLIKIVAASGGTLNTKPFISNNEDREAVVYVRPNY